jgi:Fur family transcriptional regulator, ferric uptake regulator
MRTGSHVKKVGSPLGLGYHPGLRRTGTMDIEKRISAAFREFSERSTLPRQVIARGLVRLGKSGAAFSAEDLLKRLHRSNPRIGRATVYRSIEKLVRMKVLDRIDFTDGTHYFRLCGSDGHHHHLACTGCHRVVDLKFCLDEETIDDIGRRESFSIEDHAITLFGLCKDCRANSR